MVIYWKNKGLSLKKYLRGGGGKNGTGRSPAKKLSEKGVVGTG